MSKTVNNFQVIFDRLPPLLIFDLVRLFGWLCFVYWEGAQFIISGLSQSLRDGMVIGRAIFAGFVRVSRVIVQGVLIVFHDIFGASRRRAVQTAQVVKKSSAVVAQVAVASKAKVSDTATTVSGTAFKVSDTARSGFAETIFIASRYWLAFRQALYIIWDHVRHPGLLIHAPAQWRATIGLFIVTAMICVLPFPVVYAYHSVKRTEKAVIAKAMAGVQTAQAASEALSRNDLIGAQQGFEAATHAFSEARAVISDAHPLLYRLVNNLPVRGGATAGLSLLDAGKELTLAGQDATHIAWLLSNDQAFHTGAMPVLTGIDADLASLSSRLAHTEDLLSDEVVAMIPAEQREKVNALHASLPRIKAGITQVQEVVQLLRGLAGEEQSRRYLVLFQNNTELRPTGGFIGSFAVVDIDRGQVKKIEIPGGGPYVLKSALRANIAPPQPLRLVNDKWQFQDANWFPDFPSSAEKILWFYDKADQSSVDGVIAINASLVQDILAVTGPIPMPEYGKTITTENALLEMQKSVELEYDRQANTPKQFIADLVPKVLERVSSLQADQRMPFVKSILSAGLSRDIQLYAVDPRAQAVIQKLGLAGAVAQAASDYLMIVDTNIGGAKADGAMQSRIEHVAAVQSDGTVVVTVTTTKTHTGTPGDPFTGRTYVDYQRMYVPRGAQLLSATGFTPPAAGRFKNPAIDAQVDTAVQALEGELAWHEQGMMVGESFGKTVFANWIQVAPRQSVTTTVSYLLPFRVSLSEIGAKNTSSVPYQAYIQRQAGVRNTAYDFRLTVPSGRQVSAQASMVGGSEAGGWRWTVSDWRFDQSIELEIR